jgi:hypothetical protein
MPATSATRKFPMPGRLAPLTVCSPPEGAAVAQTLKLRGSSKRRSRCERRHACGRPTFCGDQGNS